MFDLLKKKSFVIILIRVLSIGPIVLSIFSSFWDYSEDFLSIRYLHRRDRQA